jgi:hypothetical protein
MTNLLGSTALDFASAIDPLSTLVFGAGLPDNFALLGYSFEMKVAFNKFVFGVVHVRIGFNGAVL